MTKTGREYLPVFSLRCQQSGSAHIGQKLIERRDEIVRRDNVRNRSSRGDDAVCACRTGWTGRTRRAGCANSASRTSRAGRTRRAGCTYGALRTSGSLNTGSTCQAFRAGCASRTRRAGCTGRALHTLRAL